MSGEERRAARRASRKERRAAKRRRKDAGAADVLTIVPPEGVPLHFTLGGLGARLGAQLIDLAVTLAGAIALSWALIAAFDPDFATGAALFGLVFFLARVPYYVVFELLWNGRTLAKRWLGLRTVSRDGRSLPLYAIVVRNVLREIEFFVPLTYALAGAYVPGWMQLTALGWIVVVAVVPWRSRTNARLGDIIAGTAVIEEPRPVLLSDMAAAPVAARGADGHTFAPAELDRYGAYELQVLERLLRPLPPDATPEARERRRATLNDVRERIVRRIGYTERVEERDTEGFLHAFYRAQRAYLESRKLFGDERRDKRYREAEPEDA